MAAKPQEWLEVTVHRELIGAKLQLQFKNNSNEDIYILVYHTPLEGLKSSCLTVKDCDGKNIDYKGYHFKRRPPTKNDFILLEKYKSVTSPVLDLTEAYTLPENYTVEYTKPLVCLTSNEMASIEDEDVSKVVIRLPSQIEITMMQTKDKSSEIIIQFSNTSDKAVYVLKYYTPLEGLKSPFLAIKNNEGTEIKYNGYRFKRCPPTKKDFILLEGKEEKDCHINLIEAYAIPSDGEYTIEYTKPLVCFTKEEMAENKITATIGELAMSTSMPTSMPIKLQITGIIKHKFKKKDVPAEDVPAEDVPAEDVPAEDVPAEDVPANPGIIFGGNYREQEKNVTEALHYEVRKAYPQVINAVDNNPAKYQQWFGHPNPDRKAKVKKVYEKCYRGLMDNTVTYHFGGPKCDDETYGYSQYDSNEVFLCKLYIKANEKSTASAKNSKQQTLVHEWTHVYADTSDNGYTYGTKGCIALAKNDPDKATNNADNYGYFYCDIVEHLP